MTSSADKPKRQPLPVPPLVPPQGKAQETTKANQPLGIDQTKLSTLDKNNSQDSEWDLFDFGDELEEELGLEDDDNLDDLTNITSPDLVGATQKQKSTLTAPPTVPPLPIAPNKKKPLAPPNLTPTKPKTGALPGETGVRRGSPIDNKKNLRPGPQNLGRPGATANIGRSPGQPTLHDLVLLAFENGYSDVHLGVGELPRMRDRGEILTLTQYPEIDQNTFMSWLREIMREEDIQKFKKELEYDGATQYEFARVRINVFDTLRGHALVLRLIPLTILSMDQLRLPPVFRDICDAHKGLVLITGPTGSGKSTTLAAMIDHINNEKAKNIITIEDPVEFVHKSRKSLIKQREVGMHTLMFDNALKASLREDPDIILVGEMRDKETVNTALKAAQTGHLVMGTLHTNSAIKTLERIFTLYNPEEQNAIRSAIAESLVSIIAQGLCRTTDGKRAAYHDILINTETVKDYITGNKYEEIAQLMDEGEFDGMVTMNKSLFNLYEEGRITEETALENSPTRNEMAMMLRGRY